MAEDRATAEICVVAIALLLERLDVAGLDQRSELSRSLVAIQHAEQSAEVEQLALDSLQARVEIRVEPRRAGQAQRRVELVDLAVGLHLRVILRHALARAERGLPVVTLPGVDLRQANHGASVANKECSPDPRGGQALVACPRVSMVFRDCPPPRYLRISVNHGSVRPSWGVETGS